MSIWRFSGRCHLFGDDIPLDDGLISFELAMRRVMDPDKLIPHLFETIRPDFHKTARRGDVIVAGRNFACGKPHVQGFIALQAMGIGVICESMPYNSFRGAVSRGLVFMTGCSGVSAMFAEGDGIEADCSSGEVANTSRGTRDSFAPLDSRLRDIIAAGGGKGVLRNWWNERNKLAHQ